MSARSSVRHLLLLTAAVAATLLAAPHPATAAEEQFTPVVASVVAEPQPVLAGDGRNHLAYELLLINRSFNPTAKVTIRRVTALAAGKPLRSLAGQTLAAVTFPFGGNGTGTTLAPGEAAYVMMDVSFPRGTRLPRRLTHRITISMSPRSRVVATRYEAAPTPVGQHPAVVVAPPLRGSGWIVGNGCCATLTSHRAGLLPVDGALHLSERFAIDFIQVTPSGLLGTGPLTDLSSYPYFGDEIHSATAGTVVRVVDDLPETPPGAVPPTTAARAGGNHVVVAMGHHRFAFYAHLQPGSVRVRVGDRVAVGQVLGLLGSSGNSNAPHLHFQLMDGPDPLASNGIPYRFTSFDVAGTLTNFQGLFDDAPAQLTAKNTGMHAGELPLNLQVVGFP